MSPDKEARAAALRAHLLKEAPEIAAFLDEMKDDFGAKVLYVNAAGVEQGKEPEPGIKPYAPLPSSTWAYGVGESPAGSAAKKRKR